MNTVLGNRIRVVGVLCVIMAAAMFLLVHVENSDAAERPSQTHDIELATTGSGNYFEPVFGQSIASASPALTVTNGEALSAAGVWQYEAMGNWNETASEQFFAGTWRYYITIDVDKNATISQGGEVYDKYDFFDDTFNIKVNGDPVLWEPLPYQDDETEEHFLAAAMPGTWMIEAEDGGDLIFVDSSEFDIPKSYPGENIWPYSVANYVSGGASPYTFSKESGPAWISVNSENGEITGQPTAEAANDPLVVTVSDANGASKSITIAVAATAREIVNKVRAWGYKPELFDSIDMFLTVISDDIPGDFVTDEGTWQKKNGSQWEGVSEGEFSAGTWRYTCPLRINDNRYVLDESTMATVNDTEWVTSDYVRDENDPDGRYRVKTQLTATSPEFVLEPIDLNDQECIIIRVKDVAYSGQPVSADVTVVYQYGDSESPETKTLKENDDYTLVCSNNTEAGEAMCTITGKGNYTGTVTRTFQILPKSIENAEVSTIQDQTFTGQALEPAPVVTIDGAELSPGTDYEVSYGNNTEAGEAMCTITGKGNFTGTVTKKFTINAKAITPVVKLSATAYTYNGKVKTPTVTVMDGATTLKENTDYTIVYASGRTNVGTYIVTVSLKGNYKGSQTATFKIVKAVNTLKVKGKTVTVKYKALKKKNKTLKISKVLKFTNKGQGAKTYIKKTGNKKITINKKTGKVTIKKKLKKGTYKVKVKVKAKGNSNYKASATKTITFKVRVK